ncbi:unnamed protein product [Phytophthora lilii]|uniref:Unnamed protein product n=1 Tax=Phytophthora lilii TaxID=2077276 RepID=A0A9W6X0L5_9STRA|nr:unnamed protein product [Phytophthora lilii]
MGLSNIVCSTWSKIEQDKLPVLYTPINKKAVDEAKNRRHEALTDKANYFAYQYSHQPSWRPGLAFFQHLVHQLLHKIPPDMDNANSSSGVISAELPDFPVLIAPIFLRVHVQRHDDKSHGGIAVLFCTGQNHDQEHGADSRNDIASFVLKCRVYCKQNSWREHRNTLLDIVSNSSAEVCAVKKCGEDFESRSNTLHLLRSHEEVGQAVDELWVDSTGPNSNESDLFAIQKYIPFKGAINNTDAFASATSMMSPTERKAWIVRCASRKQDKHSSNIWIISGGDSCNSNSTLITSSSSIGCQLVKCTIDQAWSEPRLLASMCKTQLEKVLRVRFSELVVDLLQDTAGNWWLLQVKAFTIASIRPTSAATTSSLKKTTPRGLSRTQSAPTRIEAYMVPTPQWKKWRCAGRYCKHGDAEFTNQQMVENDKSDDKEPSGFLTKKVLRSCEFYDNFVRQQDMSLAAGFSEFSSALSFHLQYRLPKRDRSQLYESQPLCRSCLRHYHLLRQQWIETVEAPKTTTSNAIARYPRKLARFKSCSNDIDKISRAPSKLPSLHHSSLGVKSSLLTPDVIILRGKSLNTKSNNDERNAVVAKSPNYLDELAEMEQMLTEYEPPSLLAKAKAEAHPADQHHAVAILSSSSEASEEHDSIFPKWDGVNRIEAIWDNLKLKPIERQLTDPGLDHNNNYGAKQGYNSISLQQELAKVIEEADDEKCPLPPHDGTVRTIKTLDQRYMETHTIHVQHCRRVFEDDNYREELVRDALIALRSDKTNVCFVVPPCRQQHGCSSRKQQNGGDEDELVEMALRSLYIDVKQAISASSDELASDLSLKSWPMRPNICREMSGNTIVKLGPVC